MPDSVERDDDPAPDLFSAPRIPAAPDHLQAWRDMVVWSAGRLTSDPPRVPSTRAWTGGGPAPE